MTSRVSVLKASDLQKKGVGEWEALVRGAADIQPSDRAALCTINVAALNLQCLFHTVLDKDSEKNEHPTHTVFCPAK